MAARKVRRHLRVSENASRIGGMALVVASAVVLSACAAWGDENVVSNQLRDLSADEIDIAEARAENTNRIFDPEFEGRIVVMNDASGIESARELFSDSGSMVLTDDTDSAILRGASIAVSQHIPMVVFNPEERLEVQSLIADLGVTRLLVVGDVRWAEQEGELNVIRDPGSTKALGDYTAFVFESKVVAKPSDMFADIVSLEPGGKVELKPAWENPTVNTEHDKMPAIPAQSRRDGEVAPNMVATAHTPLPNLINARSYGAEVLVMPNADPRHDEVSHAMVAGLSDGPLVALGPEFGSVKEISEKIAQADAE